MNNIRGVSIAVSLLIHSFAISFIAGGNWLEKWMPVIPQVKTAQTVLQFVDSPEDIPKKKIKRPPEFVSDKPVSSKDMDKKAGKKTGRTKTSKLGKIKQIAKAQRRTVRIFAPASNRKTEAKKNIKKQDIANFLASDRIKPLNNHSIENLIQGAASPALLLQGKRGEDIIKLPGISADILSASQKGPIAFEARYHKFGPYFKQVKRKIERYWLRYLVFRYPNNEPVKNEAVLSFKILPSGKVAYLDVVSYSGDTVFRDFCVSTISNTAPYPPIPKGIKEAEENGGIDIVFTFKYD